MKLSVEAWIRELEDTIVDKESELLKLKQELKRAKTELKKKKYNNNNKKQSANTAVDVEGKRFEANATVRILTESKFPLPRVKGLLGNVTRLGREENKERWCSVKVNTGRIVQRKAKNLCVVLEQEAVILAEEIEESDE